MTYTLTVSSQGQVVIPADMRRYLNLTPGSQLLLRPTKLGDLPTITLEPQTSWVKRVKGISKGTFGAGETFIDQERQSWEQ